jgi:hypothetical protein
MSANNPKATFAELQSDAIRGPDGSAAAQGTRLLLGRRTALKLDSILSRQFD